MGGPPANGWDVRGWTGDVRGWTGDADGWDVRGWTGDAGGWDVRGWTGDAGSSQSFQDLTVHTAAELQGAVDWSTFRHVWPKSQLNAVS